MNIKAPLPQGHNCSRGQLDPAVQADNQAGYVCLMKEVINETVSISRPVERSTAAVPLFQQGAAFSGTGQTPGRLRMSDIEALLPQCCYCSRGATGLPAVHTDNQVGYLHMNSCN